MLLIALEALQLDAFSLTKPALYRPGAYLVCRDCRPKWHAPVEVIEWKNITDLLDEHENHFEEPSEEDVKRMWEDIFESMNEFRNNSGRV